MLSTDGEVVETLRAWELHTGHLCVCTILRVISGGLSRIHCVASEKRAPSLSQTWGGLGQEIPHCSSACLLWLTLVTPRDQLSKPYQMLVIRTLAISATTIMVTSQSGTD